MADQIELTNPDNYIYRFKAIAPMDNRVSQQIIPISLVNTTSANTVIFRFSGKSEDSNLTFFIYNDGVDASAGTAPAGPFPSGVITIDDQIDWLKNYVFNEEFDAKWYITQARYHPDPINCVITDLNFSNQAGGVNIVVAQMSIKIGNVGAF